jgi:hypothetical protein
MLKLDRTLADYLADYLRRIEQYESQPLGKPPRTITPEDSQFLRDTLQAQLRFNNALILAAAAMLCVLFLVGVLLIVLYRGSTTGVSIISGTTFASMLGIVRFLRRLWLDKSTMDVLICASHGMSPEETAKLVTSFYFKAVAAPTRVRPAVG